MCKNSLCNIIETPALQVIRFGASTQVSGIGISVQNGSKRINKKYQPKIGSLASRPGSLTNREPRTHLYF